MQVRDHKMNESLHGAIMALVGPQENLIGAVTRRKPGQNGAAENTRGLRKREELDRQPEGVDQTGSPTLLKWADLPGARSHKMCRPCLPYDYSVKGLI